MMVGWAAACCCGGAVVVVGRGRGALVTGVNVRRAVVVVTMARVVVVVGAGAAVVVVVGAAVVVVVGAAASSTTAGCEDCFATPAWRRLDCSSLCGSWWIAAVSNPTPRSIGMARVRSLRIFRPIRWWRPLILLGQCERGWLTSTETQTGQSGQSLKLGYAKLADITSPPKIFLAISLTAWITTTCSSSWWRPPQPSKAPCGGSPAMTGGDAPNGPASTPS